MEIEFPAKPEFVLALSLAGQIKPSEITKCLGLSASKSSWNEAEGLGIWILEFKFQEEEYLIQHINFLLEVLNKTKKSYIKLLDMNLSAHLEILVFSESEFSITFPPKMLGKLAKFHLNLSQKWTPLPPTRTEYLVQILLKNGMEIEDTVEHFHFKNGFMILSTEDGPDEDGKIQFEQIACGNIVTLKPNLEVLNEQDFLTVAKNHGWIPNEDEDDLKEEKILN